MHVYNDHVEIWNEGELPEGYDEKVLYGKHSSRPHNRNIADTMFKAGFIDTWGRGYKKIREGFEKAGLPMPTVKSHCGGTLVTFQRGYDVVSGRKNVVSDVTSLSPVQLTERQKKICDLIDDDAFISGSDQVWNPGSVAHGAFFLTFADTINFRSSFFPLQVLLKL